MVTRVPASTETKEKQNKKALNWIQRWAGPAACANCIYAAHLPHPVQTHAGTHTHTQTHTQTHTHTVTHTHPHTQTHTQQKHTYTDAHRDTPARTHTNNRNTR